MNSRIIQGEFHPQGNPPAAGRRAWPPLPPAEERRLCMHNSEALCMHNASGGYGAIAIETSPRRRAVADITR
jgi:hypothetical protein